jgi:phospholipid/cholesterol/gamma-HCH transport system permease protein
MADQSPVPQQITVSLLRFADFVGGRILYRLSAFGSASIFVFRTLALLFKPPYQFNLLVRQLRLIGVDSLSVVLVSGIFTGMVLATQGYIQLSDLSAEGQIGGFVCVSLVKELGPMVTGFVLAGRIGASITAELGTMKVTEQIDALSVMGTDPVKYLVVPRFLACAYMLPILTVFSTFSGIAGGYVVAVYLFNMNGVFFMKQVQSYLFMSSICISLIKATSFGMAIALVGCYKGFTISVAGGAEGVGKATTGSAVVSLMLILVLDVLLNHLLFTLLQLK